MNAMDDLEAINGFINGLYDIMCRYADNGVEGKFKAKTERLVWEGWSLFKTEHGGGSIRVEVVAHEVHHTTISSSNVDVKVKVTVPSTCGKEKRSYIIDICSLNVGSKGCANHTIDDIRDFVNAVINIGD